MVCDCSPRLFLDAVEPFYVPYYDVEIKLCACGGVLTFVEEVRVLVKRSVSVRKRKYKWKRIRKGVKRSKEGAETKRKGDFATNNWRVVASSAT